MFRKSSISFIALAILLCCKQGYAQTPTPEGLEYCTVCHGSQLMGNKNILAPRLSGLSDWYIERQLQAFQKGWRGFHDTDIPGREMGVMARELTDESISAIATWVAKTESPLPEQSITGDIAAGEILYETCSVCHGESAEGNEMLGAPALTGLDDWYMISQLQNYLNGYRGNDSADSYGMQMSASMAPISSNEDAINVTAYINELSNP